MTDALMRFGGVQLSHNPKELVFRRKNNVQMKRLASGEFADSDALADLGSVSGKGELFGEHCFDDLEILMQMCKNKKSAILTMPYFKSVIAVPKEISLSAEPRENYISVNFDFAVIEKIGVKAESPPVYIAEEGDSLWDIGKTPDEVSVIASLNHHIRDINYLEEGTKVKLR